MNIKKYNIGEYIFIALTLVFICTLIYNKIINPVESYNELEIKELNDEMQFIINSTVNSGIWGKTVQIKRSRFVLYSIYQAKDWETATNTIIKSLKENDWHLVYKYEKLGGLKRRDVNKFAVLCKGRYVSTISPLLSNDGDVTLSFSVELPKNENHEDCTYQFDSMNRG